MRVNFSRVDDLTTVQKNGRVQYRSGQGCPKKVIYPGCVREACASAWSCGFDNVLWNTRKVAPACAPPHLLTLKLLVTGAPGAGTTSVTSYLKSGGASVEHEEYGADGTVSWQHAVNDFAVDSRYPNNQRLRSGNQPPLWPRFARVAHLVRCPMTNILGLKSRGGRTSRAFVAAASPSPAFFVVLFVGLVHARAFARTPA